MRKAIATLAIDIGGSGLKAAILDADGEMVTERVRVKTPRPATPQAVVDAIVTLVQPLPRFHRISIGFPGVVRDGRVITAPNLGTEQWRRFPLVARLSRRLGGKPARLLNDADVQGFGVIRGSGLEFVVTLGTGVGTALFRNGHLMPHLELGQYPFGKHASLDRYLGSAALKKIGTRRWNTRARVALDAFRTLLNFDRIYLGGGNARKLSFDLPPDARIVSNTSGLTGGIRLWDDEDQSPVKRRRTA